MAGKDQSPIVGGHWAAPVAIDETKKKGSTDPYCPFVGASPPDDIPFIADGSKKLPARRGIPQLNSQVRHWKQGTAEIPHIYPIHGVPEIYGRRC
jgi:hypothetical protein